MSKRKGGYRHKTRRLWKKNHRDKGKISITKCMAEYNEGQKVTLVAEPAVQTAIFHSRFQGLTGTVIGKRGGCYCVTIHDGGKLKTIIVHPVHLNKL